MARQGNPAISSSNLQAIISHDKYGSLVLLYILSFQLKTLLEENMVHTAQGSNNTHPISLAEFRKLSFLDTLRASEDTPTINFVPSLPRSNIRTCPTCSKSSAKSNHNSWLLCKLTFHGCFHFIFYISSHFVPTIWYAPPLVVR